MDKIIRILSTSTEEDPMNGPDHYREAQTLAARTMSYVPGLDPDPAIDVFVPGRPAAQGSKRYLGPGRPPIEQSKAVAPWRADVRAAVQAGHPDPPLDGPIVLIVEFVMPRPTSTPKTRTPAAVKRPDIDKQCRAVCDALTGLAWKDDSQIVDLRATKRIAELDEGAGARIRVAVQPSRTRKPATPQHADTAS